MNYARVRVRLFTPEQGRRTPIFPRGRIQGAWYMPHFRVGSGGEYLGVAFLDGPERLSPGEEAECEVVLMYEGVDYSPLTEGVTFEVLEGAAPIGHGTVLRRWSTATPWSGLASA